jgi:deoxyribonuclease V
VETQTARVKTRFPYIPTLLYLRELGPAKAVVNKLKTAADIFLVDAQVIAHPYRFGFASHLGIILDKPTVGVAKKFLYGQIEPITQAGWAPITDRGEVIGAAVKKDENQKPVYVSVGHKVSLEKAIEIVKHCIKSARVPEPIRIAHMTANKEKREHK